METSNRGLGWAGALFAAVCFVIVIWGPVERTLCPVPNAMLQQNPAASCFEFWINRYQTLLGVLVALGAIYVTWVGAKFATHDYDNKAEKAVARIKSDFSRQIEYIGSTFEALIAMAPGDIRTIQKARILKIALKSDLSRYSVELDRVSESTSPLLRLRILRLSKSISQLSETLKNASDAVVDTGKPLTAEDLRNAEIFRDFLMLGITISTAVDDDF